MPFKCDVHGWMNAYAAVMSHPYFFVTGTDGKFELEGLPPGTYTVEAWHEEYVLDPVEVTVADGETKEIEFTFSRESKKR